MTLGDNTYGSVAEVVTLCRLVMQGQSTFNSTTRPTLTEVEGIMDRVSGVLNLALANQGFSIPVAQADAKLACNEWVVKRTAQTVFLAQPYADFDADSPMDSLYAGLEQAATEFIDANEKGFKVLGVPVSQAETAGMVFTAQTVQRDRADPANTALEQPLFIRKQFDA
jgi:hypothetical protein